MSSGHHRTLLLKLSGEALKGSGGGVIDDAEIERVCAEILNGIRGGTVRVGVVVGGGNIHRGAGKRGYEDPTRSDYLGMIATLFNALAIKDAIARLGGSAEVVAPYAVPNIAYAYERPRVMDWLARGTVVVFGGGTGHPFFTTDTAAALRAAEIGASELLKASNVDGIYSADPRRDASATRFERLSFDQALAGRYAVMDATAFAICRDRSVCIRVFDMTTHGSIAAALGSNPPGTVVGPG